VTSFIAHLTNQLVAHEILSLQILALLLERPTDDSVEIAVGFMREVGAHLAVVSPKPNNAIFDRFRAILHEGQIDKRTQYMIEVLFQVRKDKFKDNVSIAQDLDLVAEEDQITHYIGLDDDELEVQESLNIFKFDPDYQENEEKYASIKAEILGEGSDADDESGDSDEESDESEDEDDEEQQIQQKLQIQDRTNADVIALRKQIYLTIMSSVDFEECCHKLMKMNIQEGQEVGIALQTKVTYTLEFWFNKSLFSD
jgi:pre-mRNA-splicing factor CWC22